MSTTDLSTNGNKAVAQQTSEPAGDHERTLTLDLALSEAEALRT